MGADHWSLGRFQISDCLKQEVKERLLFLVFIWTHQLLFWFSFISIWLMTNGDSWKTFQTNSYIMSTDLSVTLNHLKEQFNILGKSSFSFSFWNVIVQFNTIKYMRYNMLISEIQRSWQVEIVMFGESLASWFCMFCAAFYFFKSNFKGPAKAPNAVVNSAVKENNTINSLYIIITFTNWIMSVEPWIKVSPNLLSSDP